MTVNNILMIIPSWGQEDATAAGTSAAEFSTDDLTSIATFRPMGSSLRYVFSLEQDPTDSMSDVFVAEGRYLLPVEAMRSATEVAQSCGLVSAETLLVYIHDDVTLSPGWDTALLELFNDQPACGLAGFGGALGFADADIYRRTYTIDQLARHDFLSNMEEAETHGRRYTGSPLPVAVLDGFALAIPSMVYMGIGGWQACLNAGIPFHMYDAWLSLMVQLHGHKADGRNEVWLTPVACHHAGGRTSVSKADIYNQQMKRAGFKDAQDLFDRAHETIYDEFRGMLPVRVTLSTAQRAELDAQINAQAGTQTGVPTEEDPQ